MSRWKVKTVQERTKKKWCEEEMYWLSIVYPYIPSEILAERFGTTANSLDTKACKMGLKKTVQAKHEAQSMAMKRSHKRRGSTSEVYRGYVMVYAPDHPRASKKLIPEHILVMEKKLGRFLEPYEQVMHIDQNKKNNDLSNLKVKISKYQGHIDEQELVSKRVHGVMVKDLAKQYGVTTGTVGKILKRHGVIDQKISERMSKNRKKAFEKDNKE